MKQRGYHRIVWADGSITEGPLVVSTDAEGHLVEWHQLLVEESSTEWIGGAYKMMDGDKGSD